MAFDRPRPLPFPGNGYDNGRAGDGGAVGLGLGLGPGLTDVPGPEKQRNGSGAMERNRFFYKTRLCARFAAGSCPYGDKCSFAHGVQELRGAKYCRRFISGEGCPYGEACVFPHVLFHRRISYEPPRKPPALEPTFCPESKRPRVDAYAAAAADVNGNNNVYNWDGRHSCAVEKGLPGLAHNHAGAGPGVGLGVGPSRTSRRSPDHTRDLLKNKGLKWISRIYADWIEDASLSILK